MPCPIDPSRDLLFGLLALQTGLINQAQLVAAFHAWTQARHRPMAEILAEQGAISAPCVTLLEGLVIEHLRRHGNDPERSLAAIGLGRSTREGLANLGDPGIDGTLARVGAGSTRHDDQADPDRTASYAFRTATSDGQRFRVLRPHARGGLGAVFVALDTELHREVALKQILDTHADDPVSRQRFLLEAEVTGGLEHPGIVPVYSLGTYGDGRPYYAMRFIRGDSLKEAIESFHHNESLKGDPGARALAVRKLLLRFVDVCEAIEYAHGRGVLHRDIKPSNIIVGKHGETLVVDWGLAKAIGRQETEVAIAERTLIPSSASGSVETLPGSALGTPAYMSPEQAQGDLGGLGPRSDVYSLGATLYFLLTDKPPFEGDVAAIVRAVPQGHFSAPRNVDRAIDPALEAVCLKAMALDPSARYGSARALAEDIERWMADEPVSALREPLSMRAGRWLRRHRVWVVGGAAAAVATVIGLVTVLGLQFQANSRLAAANKAESRAHDLAERRLAVAMEAIRGYHSGFADQALAQDPNMEPLRNKLVGTALDFYRKLGELLEEGQDARTRAQLADGFESVAELMQFNGSHADALAAYRQELSLREALAVADRNGRHQRALARVLRDVGTLQYYGGRRDDAEQAARRAIALCEALLAAHSASAPDEDALAESLTVLYLVRERSPEATGLLRRAIDLSEQAASRTSADSDESQNYRNHLAGYLAMLSGRRDGDAAERLGLLKRARQVYEELTRTKPGETDYRYNLASTVLQIARLQREAGGPDQARESFVKAVEDAERIVREAPHVSPFKALLSGSLSGLAELLDHAGDKAGAIERQRRAVEIMDGLARGNPQVVRYRRDLSLDLDNLGNMQRDLGQLDEASRSYRESLRILDELEGADADRDALQRRRAKILTHLGILERVAGHPGVALRTLRDALASTNGVAERDGELLYDRACALSLLFALAERSSGDLLPADRADCLAAADRAMTALRQAVALGFRDTARLRVETDLNPIRRRPDFQALLDDLTFPRDPFAP